jgi:hypothetical protein
MKKNDDYLVEKKTARFGALLQWDIWYNES